MSLVQPISLTATEGEVLATLDALLGLGRPDATRVAALGTLRPELLAAGASRIRVAVLRYLVEEGGFRERQVLRNNRRVLGRVWSPALGGALRLKYTEATSTLWLDAAKNLPAMASQAPRVGGTQAPEGDRKHRRLLRDMVVTSSREPGDWLFFAMALQSLGGFGLSFEDHQQLSRKIRQGSPLASLMDLDGEGTELELRGRYQLLCQTPESRLIECLEDRITQSWINAVSAAWSINRSTDQRIARWNTLARALTAWLGAIDGSRRMDLARPALKLFASVVKGPFARGGDAVRAELSNNGWIRNMTERADLIASVASLIAVGEDLFRRRDVLAMERYGDERYDEAQIYLRDVSELLSPSLGALRNLGRALSDTVG